MEQLSLGMLDKEVGAAMALAAKPAWGEAAEGWIAAHPSGARFTADDLIDACGTPTEVAVNANNAIGAALLAAKNRKQVLPVDRVPSRRRTNHGRFITVWERV